MKPRRFPITLLILLAGLAQAAAEPASFSEGLAALERAFDVASFGTADPQRREQAFEALTAQAAALRQQYPSRAEAIAWEGIVLSTYAGEVGAFGAMKYAKSARKALHAAEKIAPDALDGGLHASLGALYSKVPGGLIGFGDDELAAEYFAKALAVDPDNIDANYFYGEFLIDQKQYAEATDVLEHALEAPRVSSRPLFDAGRRADIEALLETARQHTS